MGLNSWYYALALLFIPAGVSPKAEVMTVAHSFVATVPAIAHSVAPPELIDFWHDFNVNVDMIEPDITPKTCSLLPVHLNGRLCDMDRVMKIAEKCNIMVIESAAQSMGVTTSREWSNRSGGPVGSVVTLSKRSDVSETDRR